MKNNNINLHVTGGYPVALSIGKRLADATRSIYTKKSFGHFLTFAIGLFLLLGLTQRGLAQTSVYYSGSGSYTVPPGVTQVTIYATGGTGGAGGQDCGNGCGVNYGAPGQYTSGTFTVSPNSTLSYTVGANGGNGYTSGNGSVGGAGAGGGGYHSGGWGGNAGTSGTSGGGGGGGGSSAVLSGSTLLLEAGGGGGGGGRCNTSGSGTAGSTNTGNLGIGNGGTGQSSGSSDGAGGGGGGGGYNAGYGGGLYGLNGEYAGYGGNSGSSLPSTSWTSSTPLVQISYTATGGTAYANGSSSTSICSGTSATISLSGYAGYIQWYYSSDGSYYNLLGSSATSFNTGNLTSARYYKALISGLVWSSVATVNIYAPTSAPSSASGVATSASAVNLSWGSGAGQGTLYYYWVLGTSPSVVYDGGGVVAKSVTTDRSATVYGLNANTTYYLRVYTSATCGNSGYTSSAAFMTRPNAPTANAQTNVRANSFTANWSVPSGGAAGYYLDVSTDNFSSYLSGYNNKYVGNVTSFSLSGLNRNTTYYYRVRAYNSAGQSTNSNTISFTTLNLNNFLVEKVGTGSIADQTAGVAFNIRITARDSYNTTVTDFTGTTAITTNSTLSAGGTTAAFSAGILASHSVTLTLAGASKTLTATYSGSPVTTGTSNTFTVLPNILHHFTLVPNGTITAGSPFTVTATAYDVYNNIKTNYGGASNILNYTGSNNVNWSTTALSASSGTARIIPASGNQTFINGVSAGITGFTFFNSDQSQLAPKVSPTITISDVATAKTGTTAPITVLNAPLDNFKVVAGITQNAGVPFTTTVTARDIYLNTCVDYEGSIRFKSSDDLLVTFPSGLQSFAPATTNRGVKVYSNEITINKIGAYWLRAADSQFAYKSGEQQNIVVSPGAFLKSAPISTITIDSPNKIAGEKVVVTLTPRDAQGNLLYACQNISVLLDGVVKTGTLQLAHGTESGLDGVYVFSVPVTSTTATNTISATFTDPTNSVVTPFDQTYDITVTPAPPSLAHTIITPDAGSITTNGSQVVTVQLKDEFDNLRTTNDGEVTLSTSLGGFGGNNASQTVTATYNGTTSGSYSATLYASYSASNHGVGTAAITGSIAFNATPGPGVWSGAAWPSDGNITDAASVAITEGLPDLVTSTFSTDKTTMSTDGIATITVQLKDHLGNLIANNRGTVTLASDRGVLTNLGYLSAGKYTATLTAGTTPVNGVGLATISGSFVGTGSASGVTGNFNDEVSSTENTITTVDITEGLPAVAQIEITAAASPITADESTLITVQLKDALGNLVVNDRGTVTLSTNLGVIGKDATFGTTDIVATYTSAGKYTATFKMNGIGVGVATITGKLDGVAITDNAQVTVINGVATQLAIATPPAQSYQPIAGVVFNAQPTIHIKDQWGNLVITGAGSTDVVTATRVTSGTASLQGTTSKAAVAGVATFTNLSYRVAETINIEFASGSLTSTTSAAINVAHNVPDYLVITGSSTQTAGMAQTITIRAYDAYNNLANRFAGSKTLTFSGANQSPVTSSYPTVDGTTFGTGTAITFADGAATASMTLYKEETVDIAANFTIGSYVDPAGYTSPTTVNINATSNNRLHVEVGQAVPAYLAITGSATQVAGETQTITITAYDGFNNPATGYTGEKTLRFSGANASLVPSTNPTVGGVDMGSDKVLTFVNGVATASMVLYKVENVSVMATDQAASGITTPTGYKLAVGVTHAPASYYAVTGSGAQTAGASQNITVTAFDAFNNQATTYAGDVAVTFSGANPSPNTPNAATNPTVQNKSGVATAFGTTTTINFIGGTATRSMALYKVETAHIVATAGSITTPNITGYDYRLQVAVNHAANSYFAITGTSTQTAGVSQNITVTMYDAYNNVATSYAGTQSLTFSGANPSPNTPNAATNPIVNNIAFGSETSLNFVAGTVTTAMNLYKVETALVTATNGTQTANTHKLSVAVSHATPNFMAITGSGTQTAGTSQDITIKAYDAYNNLATGYDGVKSLTFSGASVSSSNSPTTATSPIVSGTAFGAPTALTFASGVVTTSMSLYKVETATVTATDGTIVADTHNLSVIVSHAAPAYLAVTGNATQVAGASQSIIVTAYDAFNNVATSYSGAKSLTFSGANDAATSPVTHPTLGGTAFGTPKSLTFTSGAATGSMTLYKTETAMISATDGTINANSSASFDHRLSVLVTPTLLKDFLVYDVPDPNDLGTWQPVTVEARDTYNNRKTNYVGKITFSNTDISATNPLDYQYTLADAGIHVFDNTSGNRGVKFSQVGLDWWLTAMDLAEPAKYGYQSGITVQRAVTITANDQSKTYGDVLAMGTTGFTITGIVSGVDPVPGEITGVTLTSAGSAATATVAGSQYTITPSAATGTYSPGLYRIVYSTSGKLTVNKRNLTLTTFLANAKTYDGTTDVTGTGFSDNRVNSDALTFGYTAAFADKHAGAEKRVNYSNIVLTGGDGAGNYTLVTTSGTTSAAINQKGMEVFAVPDSKVYDGNISSKEFPVVDPLQIGDIVTITGTQTYDNETVGTGKIMKASGTVIDDGNSGNNYAISYVSSNLGTISTRSITITVTAGQTKVYGEQDPASLTYSLTSGTLASGDTFTGTISRNSGELAGTYAIGKGTLTIVEGSTNKEANYAVTFVGADFEITKRPITLLANDRSKIYGQTLSLGTTEFSLTSGTLASGETVTSVTLSSAGTINSAAVGTYSITASTATGTGGFLASNYDVTYSSGTLTVNKKELLISANTGQTKVYGADDPVLTYTATGFENSQTTDILSGSLIRVSGIHVGTYPIDLGTLSAGGNYSITYTASDFSITAKTVTVTATSGQAKTYGDVEPVLSYSSNVSLAYSDEFVGTLSRSTGEDVGTYTITQSSLSVNDNLGNSVINDYTLKYVGANFTINKLNVALAADTKSKTYKESDPALSFTSTPSVGSELSNGILISLTGTLTRDLGENVGTYTITQGSVANANYTISYTPALLTINKLDITGNFTVDASKVYDGTTSSTVTLRTLNGVISPDDVSLFGGIATYDNKNVGTNKLVSLTGYTLTGTTAGNYNLTSVATTTATITTRDLTLTNFAANSKVYNGNKIATGIGFQDNRLGSDQLSFEWIAEFDSKNVGTRTVNYKDIVIFEGADKDNYNLLTTSGTATATISQRPLTLTASGVNKEYDNTDIATVTFTDNRVSGDVFTVNYSAAFNNKNVGTGKPVSVTEISLSGTDALNYSVATTASTTASIMAKTITIIPDAGQSKLVGDADPTFTFTNSPALYSGDDFTGAIGRNPGTITPNVGNYSYTLGNLSAGPNYNLVMTTSPATFAITRNTQSISLIAGWNIISSGIIPANPDMLAVFNPLIGASKLVKIMNESGAFVEDWTVYSLGWKNTVGNILSTEGYKVKVNSPYTLNVSGSSVSLPLSIPLETGWNIISYPASANENAKSVVQALIDAGKLVKVMDERGASIEDLTAYGFGWQNNIGDFVPGKGYLVKVNANCTLTINEVLNKAATITPELIASSHFKTVFAGNGVDHMSINLMDLLKSGIHQGDEIGIFDGTSCVGAATIGADQMISGTISIPVSANDGLSETVNGFTVGNPISLKLYSNGIESSLKTEILNNTPAVFKKGESLFLKVSTDAATGISDFRQTLDVKFYPNPFTDVLSIEINSSEEKPVDIIIYDTLGRKIRSLYKGSIEGSQIIKWDGTSDGGAQVRPGIYYLRCNGLTFNGIIKR